jgi:Arc/MetJ-type ribon-helix-helix transcriptional regulator
MVKDKMVAIQAKFTLEQSHIDFLEQFRERGFKDKSSIVRMAIDKLHQELDRQDLEESAELYAQIYAEDEELRQLTDTAIGNWPE